MLNSTRPKVMKRLEPCKDNHESGGIPFPLVQDALRLPGVTLTRIKLTRAGDHNELEVLDAVE